MALVRRRIFFAKSGMAVPLIKHFAVLRNILENAGASYDGKILTDYNNGRSDRVVLERRAGREEDFQSFGAEIISDVLSVQLAKWTDALHAMIDYSETEMWQECS